MVSRGYDAYIIPQRFAQKYRYDFKPYIFNQTQISNIIKSADQLGYNQSAPFAHIVIPAIIRVLFGCGLRSSEARTIKVSQVSLDNGILYIEKSKNNISRHVPMSESLIAYLRGYAIEMGFGKEGGEYFFPSPSGGPYHETSFRDRFKAVLTMAGIPVLSNGRLPRIHDIRHSFVVHSYRKLTRVAGLDMYTALPIIAAYIGHSNIKDTERYIHLPDFDQSSIIEAGEAVVKACVPEVNFDA
jgi:integrase